MSESAKQELLRRAVQFGGIADVAAALGLPVDVLEAWMNGKATMPDRMLLPLAGILDNQARQGVTR